jgi:hypothetical protein
MEDDKDNDVEDGKGDGATDNDGCLDDRRLGHCLPNKSTVWHCKKDLHLHQTLGVQLVKNWCNS